MQRKTDNARVINGFDIDSVTDAPLQLAQYAILKVSRDKLWETISDHSGLARWTFSVSKVEIDDSKAKTPCGEDTVRACFTPIKLVIIEKIVCWQPPMMYGYAVQNFQKILPKHLGLIEIKHISEKECLLIWRSYFHGESVGGFFARSMLNIVLPDLVENLVKHFGGEVISERRARPYLAKLDEFSDDSPSTSKA